MNKWPKDNQAALIKFYGDPATRQVADQLVKVIPPFKMYYEGRQVKSVTFHKKAAAALLAALNKIWDYYDRDQSTIDKLGISKTAGTYNPRKVRGSKTKWSNHAYGAAIDINAEQNGFNVAGNIPIPMIAAFKAEGARWGGDYKSRKDPMHFEFCDGGEPQRSFDQWLAVLGGKVKSKAVATPQPFLPAAEPDFADQTPQKPVALAAPTPSPTPSPTSDDGPVRGDENLWHIQRRLKAMKFNPGGLDGAWGDATAGAISSFINARRLSIVAPTSFEMFNDVKEDLKVEIGKAEAEQFTRVIAPERATATSEIVAEKIETIDATKTAASASKTSKVWAWVLGIPGAITAFVKGIADNFETALQSPWLNEIKEFFADNILYVALGIVGIAGVIWFQSRKAENESKKAEDGTVKAFQEGRLVS